MTQSKRKRKRDKQTTTAAANCPQKGKSPLLYLLLSKRAPHRMATCLWTSPLPRIQTQRLLPLPVPFAAPRAVASSASAKAGGFRWSIGERSGGFVSERRWWPRQRRTGLYVRVSAGDEGFGGIKSSEEFRLWDSLTAKFSASANLPFLLIQLPQIILNARNLLAGNNSALLAVPWLGMLTGLLGNLSLLSYFAKKREKEAIVVQTLGVVSIYVVVSQLAMGSAMPLPIFVVVSVVVASGLVLNCTYYFGFLNPRIWSFWEDFTTIGGLSVLPQVMWSTFVPYVPDSILPGSGACLIAVVAVFMARTGKLSEKGVKFLGALSGWTATLLFMWMPIAQMWTNIQFPENIKGLSASTMLFGMIGNALMVPRALFIRDFMWFTGSSWAAFFYGYGNLVWLYCCNCISREYFLGATVGLFSWIVITFWRDTVANGFDTPLRSIKELVFGP